MSDLPKKQTRWNFLYPVLGVLSTTSAIAGIVAIYESLK
jgi:hypothetical protein